jgi:transposase
MKLVAPYRNDLFIGVECMFSWYWIADLCREQGIAKVEWHILQHARGYDQHSLVLLRTVPVPGIGKILSLVMLYEIHTIQRFPTVQDFASYCRLIKCKKESAGKSYGTSGKKIGNAYLKWAFSEAAVLFLRGNPDAQAWLDKMASKHNKARALTILAHKLGRAVYFMLQRKTVFDQARFLNS